MRPDEQANILLVDDQPAKLLSYEVMLGDLGENLIKTSSAKEALEVLLKNDVAVILIDVCMPDLDGFQLAQMIREHPRFQETAIIFISAIHLTELDSLKGYELGGVDYVPVPVVAGVLRAKVRVFVDLYRKTKMLEQLNNELEGRVTERTAELERAIARQDLLARELDHRAKNALAVIQSIVTLTRAETSADFAQAVHGRIHAMARAHTLLSQTRWDGADFTRLVNEELEPYAGDRIEVTGPIVLIKPTVAQNIALAIHELATNAAKYGALSAPEGKLAVEWTWRDDELIVRWSEQGGPPVTKPTKSGFGSKVIRAGVTAQLGGEVEFDWNRAGLQCTLRLPREHFTPAAQAAPPPAPREEASAQRLAHIGGKRVLLVEDEPLVAMMMTQLLKEMGAQVIGPVRALSEADGALNGATLDAAVLDVNLDGELVYPLADLLAARQVPLVFVTGYEAERIEPRFATSPILAKPVEPAALAAALAGALLAREERRAARAG